MNLTNPIKDSIFKRFFPTLFLHSGEQEENKVPIFPSMEKLKDINGAIQKLSKLSSEMLEQKAALQNSIAQLQTQRIEQLSTKAMQGNAENEEDTSTSVMLDKIHLIQQKLTDLEAVFTNIMAKIQQHEAERDEIFGFCKFELGQYLNERFSSLATRYHELLPEISEIVLQIQAVQDLMIQIHTGNSNGFDGNIHFPSIQHGNGNTLEPFLDSANLHYKNNSNDRKQEILIELRAAGYPIRR